ncbi:MAG TPA: LysR family transcriptional regulator [Gammaproteobacteria bacterium]|nr:LysR family transcriptional regulator [Gammaproteobacteria bacterium]MBK83387.1 LysR family transcriptional regulator [Gammaproteobacteria bacterium]HBF08079.1 LysR family transcriptional regulator [Gammaproteobacteria bacterium]HCK91710.1 LysR family transcriptional regulator [Gammaproteobacteria bacterium]
MKFDITDLKLLIAIAEYGNLTKGAQAACLAPSSASHRIKLLEDNLGTTLFIRKPRGVSLTKPGEIVLGHAKKVIATLEQMLSDITPYTQGISSQLKLWANTNATHTHLPHDLSAFLEKFPFINIALEEHSSEEILKAVANEQIEIGIIAEQEHHADVILYPYKTDRLVIVTPQEHPLNTLKKTSLKKVLQYPFVILNEGSAIHTFTMNKASLLGCHLNIRAQVKSFDGVIRMVSAGVGIALVPVNAVDQNTNQLLHVIEINDDWAKRNLMICVKNNANMSKTSQALINYLVQS